MSQIIGKEYLTDYLLIATTLANGKIDKTLLKKAQQHAVDLRITMTAINNSLYFRESKPLAVISGAGIAGLAASFELRARGFNVVIVEKRKSFSRFNIINLNVETQIFLKKFNLLETFERTVAARIKEHRYVMIEKMKSARGLAASDVSALQLDASVSFEPKNFNKLFNQDGIYSVPIGMLQTFLAENALKAGVNVFGDVTTRVVSRTHVGGVSKVQITIDRMLQPDLFFIAEGVHSTTALQLGMETRSVTTVCSGENWIFGNMTYSGRETFVISLIDTSEKALRIANVIFNAKSQAINIAVTSDKGGCEDLIREQILRTARQSFAQRAFPLEEMQSTLLATVDKPVNIINRISFPFSMGNVFRIGDAAGSSSPLAGLGGTLGLTLVPFTIRQLLDDYERQSTHIHRNFNESSEGYTRRWIQKSEGIKRFCLSVFEKEQAHS